MNAAQITSASKFLSLVLRHQPSTAHVTLDSAGWVDVDDLIASESGFFSSFAVDADYSNRHNEGDLSGSMHLELWMSAENSKSSINALPASSKSGNYSNKS